MTTWEQYIRDEDAKHEPCDADFLANAVLAAYGHLEWTVGNEDWTACFDAALSPDKTRIAYHAVVDCESGGFTDTLQKGVVAIDDANAIDRLARLPWFYADICGEHYADTIPEAEDEPADMMPDPEETADCARRWREHLDSLVSEAEAAK